MKYFPPGSVSRVTWHCQQFLLWQWSKGHLSLQHGSKMVGRRACKSTWWGREATSPLGGGEF